MFFIQPFLSTIGDMNAVAWLAISAALVPVSVGVVVFVPAGTVRLGSAQSTDVHGTGRKSILRQSASMKVVWVDTPTVAAQVIQAQAVRDRSNKVLIRKPVGEHIGMFPIAVTIQTTNPNPAVGQICGHEDVAINDLMDRQSATETCVGTKARCFGGLTGKFFAAALAASGIFGSSHFIPSLADDGEERDGVDSIVRAPIIIPRTHTFYAGVP